MSKNPHMSTVMENECDGMKHVKNGLLILQQINKHLT